MPADHYLSCRQCGTDEGLRVLRARRFCIVMCDECALACPAVDESGKEYRVIAIATTTFVGARYEN